MPRAELLARARQAHADGADVIDLGCDPGSTWAGVADAVKALRDDGLRVSLDSFDPAEAQLAAKAGAELVLSVNRTNRDAARDWGCEVVAVPDTSPTRSTASTRRWPCSPPPACRSASIRCWSRSRFGFAASLGRYLEVRRRYPDVEMMMGVGNLTELTDADSAGVNVLLLGFCQELGIRSVLTTEVINWAPAACASWTWPAVWFTTRASTTSLPKRLEPDLVLLRDPEAARARRRDARRAGSPRRRPQLPPLRRARQAARHQRRHVAARDRPVRAVRRDDETHRHRSGPRLLPGLRAGQGRDRADAGQELRAGPGCAGASSRCRRKAIGHPRTTHRGPNPVTFPRAGCGDPQRGNPPSGNTRPRGAGRWPTMRTISRP